MTIKRKLVMPNRIPLIGIDQAAWYIKKGKVIAYPCEAVMGLGCDPWQEKAVNRLICLKSRDENKGFLLIVANWQQAKSFVEDIDIYRYKINKSNSLTTWVFPATRKLPPGIGMQGKVAIRKTQHPAAKALCEFCGPLVSTSANFGQEKPAKNQDILMKTFNHDHIDACVQGPVGSADQPSQIIDVRTNEIYRI